MNCRACGTACYEYSGNPPTTSIYLWICFPHICRFNQSYDKPHRNARGTQATGGSIDTAQHLSEWHVSAPLSLAVAAVLSGELITTDKRLLGVWLQHRAAP